MSPRNRKQTAWLLAALILAAVASGPAPAAAAPDSGKPALLADRAVLLSLDGVSGEKLARLLAAQDRLPAGGLRRIAERGFLAVRSRPSTPSLTPAAHATHVTGAWPRDTGIVGSAMRDPSKPFGTKLSGFDAPLRAETLCQAAARQGRRVGVMAYPHAADPGSRCSGFGMNWVSEPLSRSRLVEISAASWSVSEQPESGSFSFPETLVLDFPPTGHRVTLVALDSTDDGRRNYDRLRAESETGAVRTITVGDWFPVEVRGQKGLAGAWCKLLSLAPDLSRAELYLGGIGETDAYPEEFRRALDERAGFWPGRADHALFGASSDHPEIYLEQSDRLTDFLTRAHLAALQRTDWDLLFLYQSEVDAVEHEFLLADRRQRGYTRERAERFAGFIDHAYEIADDSVARIEKELTARDAIFVTSDHGMTPVWREVYPNEILREAGYLRVDSSGTVSPESAVVAMASSGIAHVHLNPKAPAGTLPAVERLLSGLRVDGESPWDRVVRRDQAAGLALDAQESGDLIFLAKPGILLSMTVKPGQTVGPAEEYGAHGYRNVYRELAATFLAAGPGIAPGRAREILSCRIAGRIAEAIGIDPPRMACR